MTRRFVLTLVAGVALFSGSLMAANTPNFSGSWKLNAAKSDFGPMPAPDKMDRTIKHEDPTMEMKTTQVGQQGEITTEMKYVTDGKEFVNKGPRGEVKSVATWEAGKLVVKSKREVQGMEITITETWSLSEDGKNITIVNSISTPQGDFEAKIVMDKQ
jgi:hypothetical protein